MTFVKKEAAYFLLLLSPGGPQLDPLVEQPPVVELAEQPRLRDCIR